MRNQSITKNKSKDVDVYVNHSERGDFFIPKVAQLYLSDGTMFNGFAPNWQTDSYVGEVVFNTGMTGYVESLTDPSYAGQILVFTYPLIGNYGVRTESAESDKIQVSGVVVNEAALNWSHSGSNQSLIEWLRSQNIPILTGVDTRALTKHLRTKGTMIGSIGTRPINLTDAKLQQKLVSIDRPILYNQNFPKKVILVDCGSKQNIIRCLCALPIGVQRVPYDFDYTDQAYDGVVISNGPGDPTDYQTTIAITRKAMVANKPIFGICLGNQIIGLAAGAKTYKLKYGHRGHNQPVILDLHKIPAAPDPLSPSRNHFSAVDDTTVSPPPDKMSPELVLVESGAGGVSRESSLENCSKRGFITSQNHGYAIDEKSLPNGWYVSFKNLNDNSVEGIAHSTKPFSAVQFHPEACPGPTDTEWLFERFYKLL